MKSLFLSTSLIALAASAHGAVLASWNFETNTPADATNSAAGPVVLAETGTGSLQGVHVDAATDWSTPAGYASANSYSSNTWTVGDYIQFSTVTTDQVDITVSFAHVSSNTGPAEFRLDYGTNGVDFTPFSTYTVLANSGDNTWSTGLTIANTAYTFNLSGVTALNNQSSAYFRLVLVGVADALPPGDFAIGGTSRVDNVTVSGIPEPTVALLGSLGLLGLLRRRRLNR